MCDHRSCRAAANGHAVSETYVTDDLPHPDDDHDIASLLSGGRFNPKLTKGGKLRISLNREDAADLRLTLMACGLGGVGLALQEFLAEALDEFGGTELR